MPKGGVPGKGVFFDCSKVYMLPNLLIFTTMHCQPGNLQDGWASGAEIHNALVYNTE